MGLYPLTGGDWTFEIIRDLTETTNSLLGQYDTNGHEIIIKPGDGISPVVTFANMNRPFGTSYLWGSFIIGATAGPNPFPSYLLDNSYESRITGVKIEGASAGDDQSRRLTFKKTNGPDSGAVISVYGDADNVTIRNCNVQMSQNGYVANSRAIDILIARLRNRERLVADNLIIENCDIEATATQGSTAIYGQLTLVPWTNQLLSYPLQGKGLKIRNNTIRSSLSGIGLISSPDAEISDNDVLLDIDYWSYGLAAYGIATNSISNGETSAAIDIRNNRIRVTGNLHKVMSTCAGIYALCHTPGATVDIINNMISGVTGPGAVKNSIACISPGPATANVYHNSVYVPASGGPANNYRCAGIGTANILYPPPAGFNGVMNVRNNIVRVEEAGAVVLQPISEISGFESDYNALSFDETVAKMGLTDDGRLMIPTLNAWQANYGLDLNSVERNPFEPAGSGLGTWTAAPEGADPGLAHLFFTSFPGEVYTGVPVGVEYDIDGEPRSLSAPTMGADEVARGPAAVDNWTLYE